MKEKNHGLIKHAVVETQRGGKLWYLLRQALRY